MTQADDSNWGVSDASAAGAGLQVLVTERAGVPVVEVRGEVDVAGGPVLAEALERVSADAPALVVVDLTDVPFIDSSGLSVLVVGQRRVAEGGGEVRLAVTNPHVQKVLSITALDEAFTVVDSVDAALHD